MTKQYTHRTRSGMKARIIATDRDHPHYPVIALVWDDSIEVERVLFFTSDLKTDIYSKPHLDLVPYHPWDGVEPDTKVWVRDRVDDKWVPQFFSHYDHNTNQVHVYTFGFSKWTTGGGDTTGWAEARLASEFTPPASENAFT